MASRGARRSTSKVSFAPVAGKITVSPVTSPKFLLRPQAPCRCWDVPQVLRLSRKRGNSSAVSLSRNHSRRPVRKKVAQKRKAVDVRPRSPSLSRNRRRGRITGFQTISRSDRADCDNRPAPALRAGTESLLIMNVVTTSSSLSVFSLEVLSTRS